MMQMRIFTAIALVVFASFSGAQSVGERYAGTISAIDWNNSVIEIDDQLFSVNRSATVSGLAEKPVAAENLEAGMLIEYSIRDARDQARTPSIEHIHVLPK